MDNSETPSSVPDHLAGIRRSHPPGRWKGVLLSAVLLAGMLAVLWLVFRDQLAAAIPVDVGTVILLEQEETDEPVSASREEELLFQASGWLEPDPWPVNIAVLTDGFVQDVYVKEGEPVTNGQLVARLDPADARLAVESAEWEARAARQAVAAQSNALAAAGTRLEMARAEEQAAVARAEEARDTWERIAALAERDTTATERLAAKRAMTETQAALESADAAVRRQSQLIAKAAADLEHASAQLAAAETRLEMARLALGRTVIRSDRDGVVSRRYVEPGQKRRAAMDDPHSAIIVSVFDPEHLQVRVDVPLAEAGRMFIDQAARVSTAMLPGRVFTGRVSRIVGQADIQRNTLQAKVAVIDPDPRLRPDVLCRVEFWSRSEDAAAGGGEGAAGRHTLWVPEAALRDADAAEQTVWVIDPVSQRASLRSIRVARTRAQGYRLVLEGLRANETVVVGDVAGLEEGRRVKRRTQNE